jgi:hypothetical protein
MNVVRLAVAVLLLSVVAGAEVPVYVNEPSAHYMKNWLVLGPFPFEPAPGDGPEAYKWPGLGEDFLAASGGEANPQIAPGATVTAGAVTNTWTAYASDTDAISLDKAITTQDEVIGYAYAEIESPEDRACILAFGSNDDGRVWFNGRLVIDNPGPGGLQQDGTQVPVVLRKGRNALLVKVGERGNLWEFAARLFPIAPPHIDRLEWFRVAHDERFAPSVQPALTAEEAATLVQHAAISVHPKNNPHVLVWQGDWRGDDALALPVDPAHYGEFVLVIDTTFTGGAKQTMTVPFTAGEPLVHTLFADGASDYVIVVPPQASDSERWAGAELQQWLHEVSGVQLPIVGRAASEKAIVLGAYEPVRKLLGAEFTLPEPEDESFSYKNFGPTLAIWGGSMRGTMYGVMALLEDELGVRFYTPRVTITPKKSSYTFKYLHKTDNPGLRVRNDFYYEAFEPIWAARNRVNGAMSYRKQPGGVEGYWSVHTFYPLMPPDEFFDGHPEYYSLINGVRTHDHAQLCLTNPDVLRIITERVRKRMRQSPEYLIYSVSQNDWRNPCQCDNCQAIVAQEGSESGPMLWFVNQVAEAVEQEFPHKFIGTLAYQYTRKPPNNLKPRHNVVIRLCSIECCFSHDFVTCPKNADFVEDTRGWAAIAPHLYVWDYVVNFSHYVMPFPNFPVLQPNLQFFRDHNAIGVMEQAAYQSRGGEWAELRAYVIAKLLWNPDHPDVDSIIDDFMYGYYGRSGQHVRDYFDLLHAQVTPETHIHLGLSPGDVLFTDRFVEQAGALFDEAEKVADNEEIGRRVEMARLPVMYLKCKRMPRLALQDGTYDRFTAIVAREGITHYAESGKPHKQAFHAEMEAMRGR